MCKVYGAGAREKCILLITGDPEHCAKMHGDSIKENANKSHYNFKLWRKIQNMSVNSQKRKSAGAKTSCTFPVNREKR
jgi:hypothetical protein